MCDVGFGDRTDEVWNIIKAEAEDRSVRSRPTSLSVYSAARDRPCTRALRAGLAFMAHEFRTSEGVRPEALKLLESSLNLTGVDGIEHRVVIAPLIWSFRKMAPEWVDEHLDLLYGADAPDGLGQPTIDLVVEWGLPDEWFLKQFRNGVRNAVRRDVDGAIEHLLTAMLRDVPGYSVHETVAFLQSLLELPAHTGRTLSHLLMSTETDDRHRDTAIEFWRSVIQTDKGPADSEGLKGFGWMAYVESLDPAVWAKLTLATLQLTGGGINNTGDVARRAARNTPGKTTLNLINSLMRCPDGSLAKFLAMEQAVELLHNATALKHTNEYKRLHAMMRDRGWNLVA